MPLSTTDSMDYVLTDAIRHGLVSELESRRIYQIEPRLCFALHRHSTGNTLRVWALDPSTGEELEIVNATFWFSSLYLLNSEKWAEGAALQCLRFHVERLRQEIAIKEAEIQEQRIRRDGERQASEQTILDRFNSLFTST